MYVHVFAVCVKTTAVQIQLEEHEVQKEELKRTYFAKAGSHEATSTEQDKEAQHVITDITRYVVDFGLKVALVNELY